MTKTLLLFGLMSAGLFLNGCRSAAADDLKPPNEQPIVQPTPNKPANAGKTAANAEKATAASRTVNFKGVSFNYNPQVFGKVEPEDVVEESPLESEEDKPDGVAPKHTAFHLKYKTGEREATIRIFSIAEYRRMYAVSKTGMQGFDADVKELQKALADEKFRVEGEIPVLPFFDAAQIITARVKHLAFGNGKGIVFLTQYSQDFANLVTSEGLTYFYQGISADGKKYVLAEFPASAAFLPKDNQAEQFEGYKIPMTYDEFDEKAYKEYLAKITKRLENLPADKFEPSLKHFEEIISSLKF